MSTVAIFRAQTSSGPAPAGESWVISIGTAGLSTGDLVCVVAPSTAGKTDANDVAKMLCIGAYQGVAGKIAGGGVVTVRFSQASSTPVSGNPVYLARSDDHPSGSEGKATADPPSAGFCVSVGTIKFVNPGTYPIDRLADIVFSAGLVVKRATA